MGKLMRNCGLVVKALVVIMGLVTLVGCNGTSTYELNIYPDKSLNITNQKYFNICIKGVNIESSEKNKFKQFFSDHQEFSNVYLTFKINDMNEIEVPILKNDGKDNFGIFPTSANPYYVAKKIYFPKNGKIDVKVGYKKWFKEESQSVLQKVFDSEISQVLSKNVPVAGQVIEISGGVLKGIDTLMKPEPYVITRYTNIPDAIGKQFDVSLVSKDGNNSSKFLSFYFEPTTAIFETVGNDLTSVDGVLSYPQFKETQAILAEIKLIDSHLLESKQIILEKLKIIDSLLDRSYLSREDKQRFFIESVCNNAKMSIGSTDIKNRLTKSDLEQFNNYNGTIRSSCFIDVPGCTGSSAIAACECTDRILRNLESEQGRDTITRENFSDGRILLVVRNIQTGIVLDSEEISGEQFRNYLNFNFLPNFTGYSPRVDNYTFEFDNDQNPIQIPRVDNRRFKYVRGNLYVRNDLQGCKLQTIGLWVDRRR